MPFHEGFVIWKVVFLVWEVNWPLRTLLSGWLLPVGRVVHVSGASRTGMAAVALAGWRAAPLPPGTRSRSPTWSTPTRATPSCC